MNYISQASGEIEEIQILVKENQWKPKHSSTRVERKTFIKFPTSLFHRLTRFLEEFSEIPIQPRINDMTSETTSLLTKTQRIATFTFTLSVRILGQAQESDRMVPMSKDLQTPINQKVKSISLGSNSMNSYWPAKTFTMNYTKIIIFKPNNSESNDETHQTNNSESNDETHKTNNSESSDANI
jgi:hypothetical protein